MQTSVNPKITFQGTILMLLIVIVGGTIAGGVAYGANRLLNMSWPSAVFGGLTGLIFISIGVWQARLRDKVLKAVFGLLMGVVILGVFEGANYLTFRQQVLEQIREAYGNALSDEAANQIYDEFMLDEVNATGLVGYIKYALEYSTVSGSYGVGERDAATPEILFYYVLDIVIIFGFSVGGAVAAGGQKFCEHCNRFYGKTFWGIGERLGSVSEEDSIAFMALLRAQHYDQAKTFLHKKMRKSFLQVQIERCPTCFTNPITLLVQSGDANNLTTVFQQEITIFQYQSLMNTN